MWSINGRRYRLLTLRLQVGLNRNQLLALRRCDVTVIKLYTEKDN